MKKKLFFVLVACIMVLCVFLTACGKTDSDNNPDGTDVVTPGTDNQGNQQQGDNQGQGSGDNTATASVNVDLQLTAYSDATEEHIYSTYRDVLLKYYKAMEVDQESYAELEEATKLADAGTTVTSVINVVENLLVDAKLSETSLNALCDYVVANADTYIGLFTKYMGEEGLDGFDDADIQTLKNAYNEIVKLTGAEAIARVAVEGTKFLVGSVQDRRSQQKDRLKTELQEVLAEAELDYAATIAKLDEIAGKLDAWYNSEKATEYSKYRYYAGSTSTAKDEHAYVYYELANAVNEDLLTSEEAQAIERTAKAKFDALNKEKTDLESEVDAMLSGYFGEDYNEYVYISSWGWGYDFSGSIGSSYESYKSADRSLQLCKRIKAFLSEETFLPKYLAGLTDITSTVLQVVNTFMKAPDLLNTEELAGSIGSIFDPENEDGMSSLMTVDTYKAVLPAIKAFIVDFGKIDVSPIINFLYNNKADILSLFDKQDVVFVQEYVNLLATRENADKTIAGYKKLFEILPGAFDLITDDDVVAMLEAAKYDEDYIPQSYDYYRDCAIDSEGYYDQETESYIEVYYVLAFDEPMLDEDYYEWFSSIESNGGDFGDYIRQDPRTITLNSDSEFSAYLEENQLHDGTFRIETPSSRTYYKIVDGEKVEITKTEYDLAGIKFKQVAFGLLHAFGTANKAFVDEYVQFVLPLVHKCIDLGTVLEDATLHYGESATIDDLLAALKTFSDFDATEETLEDAYELFDKIAETAMSYLQIR